MEKIILVHYINVGNKSPEKVSQMMAEINAVLSKEENIIHYVYPVRDQETRVECINPKLVSEEDYNSTKEVLKRNQEIVTRLLSIKMGL